MGIDTILLLTIEIMRKSLLSNIVNIVAIGVQRVDTPVIYQFLHPATLKQTNAMDHLLIISIAQSRKLNNIILMFPHITILLNSYLAQSKFHM